MLARSRLRLAIKGAGVGVAVIDSGITSWHDDLTYHGTSSAVRTKADQRVVAFADFVNGRTSPYDDNGHGTHVAGTIAGNGYDSSGARAGIAPEAHLVGLKVLDENGRGVISDVIAALEWAIANKNAYNIRVANLSVGAAVTESYWTDPLTLAAKRAVDAGIVVVAAAGNLGKNKLGQSQYGGITAPGNAPWVLTVGAYSHEGTLRRNDDVVAAYSSRGPSAIDFEAKPDVVAPGTGVVSLSDPASLFYSTKSRKSARWYAGHLLQAVPEPERNEHGGAGRQRHRRADDAGESFADAEHGESDPAVHGAAVQWLQRAHAGRRVPQRRGAVKLARYFKTAKAGDKLHLQTEMEQADHLGQPSSGWRLHPIRTRTRSSSGRSGERSATATATTSCGARSATTTTSSGARSQTCRQHRLGHVVRTATTSCGARVTPTTSSGAPIAVAPTATTSSGARCVMTRRQHRLGHAARRVDNIVWGTLRDDADNIVWGTLRDDGDNIVWGTLRDGDNIVWGTSTSTSWRGNGALRRSE